MSCTIIGDSIAVGLSLFLPTCHHIAKTGISSQGFVNSHHYNINADTVVISLGTNDGVYDFNALMAERERIKAKKVIWLLPFNNKYAKSNIIFIANALGDKYIAINATRDGMHPTNQEYKSIARDIAVR